MKLASYLAIVVLAASVTAPGRAEVRASTTLQGFGWTLVDLRPDDSVAPAFYLGTLESHLAIEDGILSPYREYEDRLNSFGLPPPPQTISYTLGARQVSASFLGTILGTQLQASGPHEADSPPSTWQRAESEARLTYYMAPGTEVTFHAQLTAEAESDDPITGLYTASGVLQAFAYSYGARSSDLKVYSTKLGLGETESSRIFDVSLTIANSTTSLQSGWLSIRQAAHVGNISAVPEPSSYAMLAAGLAVLALWCGAVPKRSFTP